MFSVLADMKLPNNCILTISILEFLQSKGIASFDEVTDIIRASFESDATNEEKNEFLNAITKKDT